MPDGKVSVRGVIVNASCALRTDDREQIVVVPPVPLYKLRTTGLGDDTLFQIYLSNCLLHGTSEKRPGWTDFNIMIDGKIPEGGMVELPGEKQNTRLQITQTGRAGRTVSDAGDHGAYSLRLVASSPQVLTGEVSSSVRFTFDYY
ncbi:fimbrial protein [Klebsiella aerogenes]|uniref:fimbrial protein n=1 Tax=Klebsiella aerogenes TaxID=548 RepID=UPI0034D2EE4A